MTIGFDSEALRERLAAQPQERAAGYWYELEHLLLDAATGTVLCASTDWTPWLAQVVACQAQRVHRRYASRPTGRFVPVNATLAGGRP